EIHGSTDEIWFRLLDDGNGYIEGKDSELSDDQLFQRIRTHISRHGGWFQRKPLQSCGEIIEFRIPMASGRFPCRSIRTGTFEALLPASCIAELSEDGGSGGR